MCLILDNEARERIVKDASAGSIGRVDSNHALRCRPAANSRLSVGTCNRPLAGLTHGAAPNIAYMRRIVRLEWPIRASLSTVPRGRTVPNRRCRRQLCRTAMASTAPHWNRSECRCIRDPASGLRGRRIAAKQFRCCRTGTWEVCAMHAWPQSTWRRSREGLSHQPRRAALPTVGMLLTPLSLWRFGEPPLPTKADGQRVAAISFITADSLSVRQHARAPLGLLNRQQPQWVANQGGHTTVFSLSRSSMRLNTRRPKNASDLPPPVAKYNSVTASSLHSS